MNFKILSSMEFCGPGVITLTELKKKKKQIAMITYEV